MKKQCPECNNTLQAPSECIHCGWRAAQNKAIMPTLNDLKAEIKAFAKLDPEVYLRLLESPQPHEAPSKVFKAGTMVWQWPYRERVLYCVKKFDKLPRVDQDMVIAARQDKIYWRGDEMSFFHKVINATTLMRDIGVEQYKQFAREKLKALYRGKSY